MAIKASQVYDQEQVSEGLKTLSSRGQEILTSLGRVILGQEKVLTEVLVALIARGHILLEGPPGVGKTFTLKAIARSSGLSMKRVQCTPELMPSDILGGHQLKQGPHGPELTFRDGPIFTEIFFADEINRATPRTQSALLEAMGERQVTIDGGLRPLSDTFIVVATQNPLDHEGTYPLPEAQSDRFFFKTLTPHPSRETLNELLDFRADEALHQLKSLSSSSQLTLWSELSALIPIHQRTRQRILDLIILTRPDHHPKELHPYIADGLSPRAARDLYRACQVHAGLMGRLVANDTDFERCVYPALRHRLRLTWEARSSSINADELIAKLLQASVK
jgi:MoxR-like ATPase